MFAFLNSNALPRDVPSCTLRGQEGHSSRYIRWCGAFLSGVPTDRAWGNSIDSSLGIEALDLVMHSVEETIVQASFARGKSRSSFGFCHDNRWACYLSLRGLLVLSHTSQEMLDGEERAPDVDSIVLLPFGEGEVPNGRFRRLIF